MEIIFFIDAKGIRKMSQENDDYSRGLKISITRWNAENWKVHFEELKRLFPEIEISQDAEHYYITIITDNEIQKNREIEEGLIDISILSGLEDISSAASPGPWIYPPEEFRSNPDMKFVSFSREYFPLLIEKYKILLSQWNKKDFYKMKIAFLVCFEQYVKITTILNNSEKKIKSLTQEKQRLYDDFIRLEDRIGELESDRENGRGYYLLFKEDLICDENLSKNLEKVAPEEIVGIELDSGEIFYKPYLFDRRKDTNNWNSQIERQRNSYNDWKKNQKKNEAISR